MELSGLVATLYEHPRGDINIHIDINMNIDIKIIIDMNTEDYKKVLFILY